MLLQRGLALILPGLCACAACVFGGGAYRPLSPSLASTRDLPEERFPTSDGSSLGNVVALRSERPFEALCVPPRLQPKPRGGLVRNFKEEEQNETIGLIYEDAFGG